MSTLRVVRLLARLSARRWFNRLAVMRSKKKTPGRSATARKSARSQALLVFLGTIMLLNMVVVFSQTVSKLGRGFEIRRSHELGTEPARYRPGIWPTTEAWPEDEEVARDVVVALGIVVVLLFFSFLFTGLGTGSQELAQVGWSMEWLFTFPVSTRGLFLARIGEYALTNVFAWFLIGPLFFVTFWNMGLEWLGLPIALLLTFYVSLLVASLRVVAETWLRKTLALHHVKNVQAGCTVVGMLCFFAALGAVMAYPVPELLLDAADALPIGFLAVPPTAPLLLGQSAAAIPLLFGFAALFATAALALATHLVRDGLIASGGPYQGTRGATPARRPGRLRGMLGKEVRLLMRDRNFMVQTLLTPILILGFWLVLNRRILDSGGSSGAVLAFAVGAYVLVFGGFGVLAVERRSLWLLFTFPRRIDRLMREKATLWGGVAVAYAFLTMLFALQGASFATPFLALSGVFVFAYFVAGLAVIGTDPFEEMQQKRVGKEWMYLYMLLASSYGHALSGDHLWPKIVMLFLVCMTTYAIWLRAAERIPLLLDPTQLPPRRISLSHGLVAALVFFQLDVVLSRFGPVFAYLFSGVFIVAVMVLFFWRAEIPPRWRDGRPWGLARALGLRGAPVGRALVRGIAVGVAAGLLGLLYLATIHEIEALRDLWRNAFETVSTDTWWTFAKLAVFAAPLFEEFLFRGLVYQGLRQSTTRVRAILLSALVFAIVHPPISFVPVFCLGVAVAWLFDRTRSLWAPIVAHATYNAIVVLLGAQLFHFGHVG